MPVGGVEMGQISKRTFLAEWPYIESVLELSKIVDKDGRKIVLQNEFALNFDEPSTSN